MKIDLENFVSEFNKEKFPSYYVRNAKMYGWELAYIEIETGAFNVALDIDFRGNVWLVFRDYESLTLFQKSLKRDFDFKTLIYDGRNKKYKFSRIPLDETDTVSIARGITNEIIGFYNNIADDFYARKQTELTCAIESHQYRDLLNKTLDDMCHFFKGKRLSALETVQRIKEQQCGFTRYDNDEIMLMQEKGVYYQKANKMLMHELRNISTGNYNTLVCFPGMQTESDSWLKFWSQYWFLTKCYLDQPVYGDTRATTPDGFYQSGKKLADAWMDIWAGKNICIVAVENVVPDPDHFLFSNTGNKEVIRVKDTDAYNDIDPLTEQCLMKKDIDLFLIAAGPAGTVLSARLADNGRTALDIGNLVSSYNTVFPEQLQAG